MNYMKDKMWKTCMKEQREGDKKIEWQRSKMR